MKTQLVKNALTTLTGKQVKVVAGGATATAAGPSANATKSGGSNAGSKKR